MSTKSLLILGLALASANAMACYTVFDRHNRVAYQAEEPPVDMSQPVRPALERRWPGAHLVIEEGACQPVPFVQLARPEGAPPRNTLIMGAGPGKAGNAARSSSPLLTDRHTATARNLPHQVLSGDIVVVPADAAARANLPSFTVIPSIPTAEE